MKIYKIMEKPGNFVNHCNLATLIDFREHETYFRKVLIAVIISSENDFHSRNNSTFVQLL